MKRIELLESVKDQINAHGESSYPHECCGILFGKIGENKKIVSEIRALENANDESPGNRYLIPPDAIVKGEQHARENQLDIVGFYHSHPDVAARPSEFDQEHAWPWYSYIILAVEKGMAREMRSWELHSDRSGFLEESIVLEQELDVTTRGGS